METRRLVSWCVLCHARCRQSFHLRWGRRRSHDHLPRTFLAFTNQRPAVDGCHLPGRCDLPSMNAVVEKVRAHDFQRCVRQRDLKFLFVRALSFPTSFLPKAATVDITKTELKSIRNPTIPHTTTHHGTKHRSYLHYAHRGPIVALPSPLQLAPASLTCLLALSSRAAGCAS